MADPVPAARRVLAVLRYLAGQARPVPAAAIARELDLPRSTTYHLLAALEDDGFVTHLPEERRYGLGLATFELGSAYLRHDGLERLGRPVLARSVDRVGRERAAAGLPPAVGHLGILDGRDLLYLAKHQPEGADLLVTEVGVRLPAHLTASGRSILAFLPDAQVAALFPSGQALGRRTTTGPDRATTLRRILTGDRDRGWSLEDGEISDGFTSVAAAAFDHLSRPVASVGLTVRRTARDEDERAGLVTAAREAATALTSRLGGTAPR